MLDAVIKGILVGLFMAISVGPTVFIIIRYSLNYSYKSGLAFVLGVSFSDFMYVTLANVAAPLLERLKPYERHIMFGGAVVLMIMGLVGIFRKHKTSEQSTNLPASGGHYVKIWLSGFLVNTLNPGVLITWLGIVTLTVNTTIFHRIILFGTCLVIILGIDFLKVFLASRVKKLLTANRIIIMQRISAACIFGIGTFLLIKALLHISPDQHKEKEGIDKILSRSEQCIINKTYSPIRS